MGFFKKKRNEIYDDTEEKISLFERSLIELTPNDIAPPQKKSSSFSAYGVIRILLIFICLSVFAYCVYLFVNNMIEYDRADDIYLSISDEFFDLEKNEDARIDDKVSKMKLPQKSIAIPIFAEAIKLDDSEINRFYSEGNSEYNMEFERMKSKLEALHTQNSDIVGFICAEGTKISYPVTRYTDNEFYLDHSFDKKTLKSGTIFMDYRNLRSIGENKNIVIYGHNMSNGSMLGGVTKFYKNESFFNNTPIIFYAFDGIYTFEVFSVYKTSADYQYFKTEFNSREEFLNFAKEVKGNSIYQKDVTFKEGDIILTLSTCTNTTQLGRYALHARLTRIDK